MYESMGRCLVLVLLCGAAWLLPGCDSPSQKKQQQSQPEVSATQEQKSPVEEEVEAESETSDDNSVAMFDGETLDGWELIEFGGEGDIEVVDGEIRMDPGDPLTGICVTEDTELPTSNYEISLEGMKLDGHDFFSAVTFPVTDSFCTLVVGGWGGQLVGLSNLDGQDASSNHTRVMRKFEKDRWYAIRIQVLPDRITAWIDDEKLVDESIEGVEVSIRGDIIGTTPLGITSFQTYSSIRNIKLRKMD